MSLNEFPLSALAHIVQILNQENVAYLVGGSVASSIQGILRATNDIDILAKFSAKKVESFLDGLTTQFIFDPIAIKTAIADCRSFNIIHDESFVKIDFFTKVGEYQEEQLKRAIPIRIPNIEVMIKTATPEDIILSKLSWYVLGNCVSERQIRDVEGVVKVQGAKLDLGYLQSWAIKLSLSSHLERVLGSL